MLPSLTSRLSLLQQLLQKRWRSFPRTTLGKKKRSSRKQKEPLKRGSAEWLARAERLRGEAMLKLASNMTMKEHAEYATNKVLWQHFLYEDKHRASLSHFRKVKKTFVPGVDETMEAAEVFYLRMRECDLCRSISRDQKTLTRRFRYVPPDLRDTIKQIVLAAVLKQEYDDLSSAAAWTMERAKNVAQRVVHEWIDFATRLEFRREQVPGKSEEFCEHRRTHPELYVV